MVVSRILRGLPFVAGIVAVLLHVRAGPLPDQYANFHDLPTDPERDMPTFSRVPAVECIVLTRKPEPAS